MRLNKFYPEVHDDLARGKDQVIIGAIGPQEKFIDNVDKRRRTIEFLATMTRSY